MWHLTLGGGESYPERLGVPNCVYYMRTGVCGYGGRCRYNHPRDRAAVTISITLRFCIRLELHASVFCFCSRHCFPGFLFFGSVSVLLLIYYEGRCCVGMFIYFVVSSFPL